MQAPMGDRARARSMSMRNWIPRRRCCRPAGARAMRASITRRRCASKASGSVRASCSQASKSKPGADAGARSIGVIVRRAAESEWPDLNHSAKSVRMVAAIAAGCGIGTPWSTENRVAGDTGCVSGLNAWQKALSIDRLGGSLIPPTGVRSNATSAPVPAKGAGGSGLDRLRPDAVSGRGRLVFTFSYTSNHEQ